MHYQSYRLCVLAYYHIKIHPKISTLSEISNMPNLTVWKWSTKTSWLQWCVIFKGGIQNKNVRGSLTCISLATLGFHKWCWALPTVRPSSTQSFHSWGSMSLTGSTSTGSIQPTEEALLKISSTTPFSWRFVFCVTVFKSFLAQQHI